MLSSALRALLLLAIASLAVDASPSAAAERRVFLVRDYGAGPDDNSDSGHAIRAAIQAAVASGPGAEVVFDAGTYRVKPRAPREPASPFTKPRTWSCAAPASRRRS
jgi:hypothetical protein